MADVKPTVFAVLRDAYRPSSDARDAGEVVDVIARWIGIGGSTGVAAFTQQWIPGVKDLAPWMFPLVVFVFANALLFFYVATRYKAQIIDAGAINDAIEDVNNFVESGTSLQAKVWMAKSPLVTDFAKALEVGEFNGRYLSPLGNEISDWVNEIKTHVDSRLRQWRGDVGAFPEQSELQQVQSRASDLVRSQHAMIFIINLFVGRLREITAWLRDIQSASGLPFIGSLGEKDS